jgi:hypothetical protein
MFVLHCKLSLCFSLIHFKYVGLSHYSLGYLQFQDADFGSSLNTSPHIRRLNPIPAASSSASLSTSSSLLDLRDWKTLLSGTTVEGSRGRVVSAQSFGTSLFLTPGQLHSAANKFRLPSIDGGGKPLQSWRHQFRAAASLDNRKLLTVYTNFASLISELTHFQ